MKRDSLFKIYVGSKRLGSNFPVLVVTSDNTENKLCFGEHFLFADITGLPFLCRRDVVWPENARPELFDFDSYPQIFSTESLLKNQFASARVHLESAFSSLDMRAFKEIFWEGRPFEFVESDDYPLLQFHIWGKYTKEMDAMFKHSRNKKLRELHEKLSGLPKIKIESDYGNGK